VRELTAAGRGGVSVVEVAGRGALERVRSACPRARLEPGRIVLARIGEPDDVLDEALVVTLDPERVELHLHGSPALVREVLVRLGEARSGDPAATLEERAAELLAQAPCEAAARILLDQAEGALRAELAALVRAPPAEQDRCLDALLARSAIGAHVLRPVLVALTGPANAGKSTLFNLLVGAERALVTAEAGTTRDVLVERAHLGPYPVDLADGPGERDLATATDRVALLEQEGGRLARGLLERAALVVWLGPATGSATPPEDLPGGRAVVLASQADLVPGARRDPGRPSISALRDPAGTVATLARLHRERLGLPEQPWEPGSPLLFELEQVRAVRRARSAQGAERARLLHELLGPSGTETGHGR